MGPPSEGPFGPSCLRSVSVAELSEPSLASVCLWLSVCVSPSQVGFSADSMQLLIHWLCHTFCRCPRYASCVYTCMHKLPHAQSTAQSIRHPVKPHALSTHGQGWCVLGICSVPYAITCMSAWRIYHVHTRTEHGLLVRVSPHTAGLCRS